MALFRISRLLRLWAFMGEPESEIEAVRNSLRLLVDAMAPLVLASSLHHEQRASRQQVLVRDAHFLVLKDERARVPEGDGTDDRLRMELKSIIGVHADGIRARAVVVQQYAKLAPRRRGTG